jgi:hypothetical protein
MAVFLVCAAAVLVVGGFVLAIRRADRLERELFDLRERQEHKSPKNDDDSEGQVP